MRSPIARIFGMKNALITSGPSSDSPSLKKKKKFLILEKTHFFILEKKFLFILEIFFFFILEKIVIFYGNMN